MPAERRERVNVSIDHPTDQFPIDWDEWQAQWQEWLADNVHRLHRTSLRAPGKNFLADKILGIWGINYANGSGTAVELSEVTMPDFGAGRGWATRKRYVGITWIPGPGKTEAGGVVESFAELEAALGFDHTV